MAGLPRLGWNGLFPKPVEVCSVVVKASLAVPLRQPEKTWSSLSQFGTWALRRAPHPARHWCSLQRVSPAFCCSSKHRGSCAQAPGGMAPLLLQNRVLHCSFSSAVGFGCTQDSWWGQLWLIALRNTIINVHMIKQIIWGELRLNDQCLIVYVVM